MPEQQLTRRDRYRRRTVAEIKEAAMAQVRSGGPEALSLAAIARTMAMSAPALRAQLHRSNDDPGQRGHSAGVLHFGLVWWSRLHGLISLELGQHTVGTGIDPGLLYRSEVETMVDSLPRGVTAGPCR